MSQQTSSNATFGERVVSAATSWWDGLKEIENPSLSRRILSLTAKACVVAAVCCIWEVKADQIAEMLPNIPPPSEN